MNLAAYGEIFSLFLYEKLDYVEICAIFNSFQLVSQNYFLQNYL